MDNKQDGHKTDGQSQLEMNSENTIDSNKTPFDQMQEAISQLIGRLLPNANPIAAALTYWTPPVQKTQNFLSWFVTTLLLGGILGNLFSSKEGNVGIALIVSDRLILMEFGRASTEFFTLETFKKCEEKPLINEFKFEKCEFSPHYSLTGDEGLIIKSGSSELCIFLPRHLISKGNPDIEQLLESITKAQA